MVSEDIVRNAVIIWLSRNNYELLYIATTRGRPPRIPRGPGRPRIAKPPDLIAKRRNQNYYYFVEAKGDPPSSSKFQQVMGEIMCQMARKAPAAYAIAVPISFKSVILNLWNFQVWKKSHARFLFFKNWRVFELRPSVRDFNGLKRI